MEADAKLTAAGQLACESAPSCDPHGSHSDSAEVGKNASPRAGNLLDAAVAGGLGVV